MISIIESSNNINIDFIYSYNDDIYRQSNTFISKLILRIKTYLIFPLKIFYNRKHLSNKYNKVVVITSPFYLPSIVAKYFTNSEVIVLYNDIYPQALIDKKIITENSFLYKIFVTIQKKTYLNSNNSVFISDDHLKLAKNKYGFLDNTKHEIIFVPAHTNALNALYSDNSKITIIYSGTLGLFHDFSLFILFLKNIKTDSNFVIKFNTSGFAKNDFESTIKKMYQNLLSSNIIQLGSTLNEKSYEDLMVKAQLGIIFQDNSAGSVVFPSKFASMLVSGHAILGFMKKSCQMARIIIDNDLGWVIDNNENILHVNVLREICNPEILQRKRINSLKFGSINFSINSIADKWSKLLTDAK